MIRTIDINKLNELKDRYAGGVLDRRTFLGLVGLAGLASGVVGGPLKAWAQAVTATEIKLQGWGGIVQEAIRRTAVVPFEKATGVKVVESTVGLEEELFAKAKAGRPGDFNLINSAGIAWYKRWIDSGFGVVINEKNIPNMANVLPALIEPFRKVTPEGISAVPISYGNTGVVYNRKFISDDRAKAEREMLLIAPDLKDKLSGHNSFQTRIWIGALQTKQNPNAIQNIDAVWEKVRLSRSLVKKYWSSGAESTELMASGEIHACDIWSGRAASLMARDPNMGWVEFSSARSWLFDLMVLKGSPLETCEQFINFFLEPEVTIAVAEAQLYPPPLDPNKVTLSDMIKGLPNFDPTGKLENYTFEDPNYWTENEKDWKPIYSRIEKGF